MIAYLSNDQKLIKVLNEDGDVFKMITAQWKNIPVEDVTAEQRAQAKQVYITCVSALTDFNLLLIYFNNKYIKRIM